MGESTINLTGTGSGTYVLDAATGWADSYSGNAALSGTFTAGPLKADVNVTATQGVTSTFQ